jgi:hypothetical protein
MRDAMIGVGVIGIFLGMLLAAVLLHTPWSSWVNKDALSERKTICMKEYYVQYSSVRRFPK